MQTVLTTIGLLLNFICVSQLVKYKRNYGADEITWKRLREYLGSTYNWFIYWLNCRNVLNRDWAQLECTYSNLLKLASLINKKKVSLDGCILYSSSINWINGEKVL